MLRNQMAVTDAIERALFEATMPTLSPLMHLVSRRDNCFAEKVDELADAPTLLPDRVGLPDRWSVSDLDRLQPAIVQARKLPACVTPRAKIECFLGACEEVAKASNGMLSADELIPMCAYTLVSARLHQLPSDLCLIKLFITDEREVRARRPLHTIVQSHSYPPLLSQPGRSRRSRSPPLRSSSVVSVTAWQLSRP